MRYRVELLDTCGRRIAAYDEVPLFEVVCAAPDEPDIVRGLLPESAATLGAAFRVRVYIEGVLCCEAEVVRAGSEWSDTRKLILDRYVPFHHTVEIEAERPARDGNRDVSRAFTNQEISAIVRSLINSTPGAVHYTVTHTAFPAGAQREYAKFDARKTEENELGSGGITDGQWVGADRIDAANACAKDGDTISGLVVDGIAWPDVRLMMIDAEEATRNSHAIDRHPEVAAWSEARYAASGYKRRADKATAYLQSLITAHGIDYIELNPHRNADGEFDDRIDAYGRYVALVFGGGLCFNAAMVEQGHAEVYLYQEGRYHVPEMALKDFYSYYGAHEDSISYTGVALTELDVSGGVLEMLAALAYAAGGHVFAVAPDLAVRFYKPILPDHVVCFDLLLHGVRLGAQSTGMANYVTFQGNLFTGALAKRYTRADSIDIYGVRAQDFDFYSVSREEDADKFMQGILADLAYPEPAGFITFFRGHPGLRPGDLIEVRGAPLRRLDPPSSQEWDGRFAGRLIGRARRVRHRFSGAHTETTVDFTSPLRSVSDPFGFIVRSQEGPTTLFEFRLDDARVGLEMGFHLD